MIWNRKKHDSNQVLTFLMETPIRPPDEFQVSPHRLPYLQEP